MGPSCVVARGGRLALERVEAHMSEKLRTRAAARDTGLSVRTVTSPGWRLKYGMPAYKIGRALVFDSVELSAWFLRHAERSHDAPEGEMGAGE